MSRFSFFVAAAGLAALALCVGCAQQPVRSAAAQAPASTAPATSMSHKQLLSMARDFGYHAVSRDGKTIYCHKEVPTGSMLPIVRCINAESLRFAVMQAQRERQLLNQTPSFTGSNGN